MKSCLFLLTNERFRKRTKILGLVKRPNVYGCCEFITPYRIRDIYPPFRLSNFPQ